MSENINHDINKSMNMTMAEMLVIVVMALWVGGIIGYLSCIIFESIAANIQIKYVAQEEIIELEKQRLQEENTTPESSNLFFGDIENAAQLTMKLAMGKSNRSTKVIFSLSPVFADGVESISREIHKEVIELMQSDIQEKQD